MPVKGRPWSGGPLLQDRLTPTLGKQLATVSRRRVVRKAPTPAQGFVRRRLFGDNLGVFGGADRVAQNLGDQSLNSSEMLTAVRSHLQPAAAVGPLAVYGQE